MSGFFGTIHLDSPPPAPELLKDISKLLAPRGPDATKIVTQPNAAFVFTFLRTGPAPQSDSQPISLDGQTWLIGDVRLDGREDLRRKLEQCGARIPSSATDEELVLHAYHSWGDAELPQLLGDFSFALWNSANRRVLCVRDLLGLKPLFYGQTTTQFCVSNTIEALRLIPEVSSTLDPLFIADFLVQEWSSDPERTAFRDIRRLPPGHFLRLESGALQIRRYTSLPIEEPLSFRRPEDCTEHFRALLGEAIRDRMPQNSTAIFMSAGLDSTSIAALAVSNARKRGEPLDLHAYTVDAHPAVFDEEGKLATLVAQHLGIPIEITSLAEAVPFAGCDDPQLQTPEPFHDPYVRTSRSMYRQAARHARVAWNGYGGDDVLAGQAWPYLTYLLRRGRLGTALASFGGYILKNKRVPTLRGGFRSRLQRWIQRPDPMSQYPGWLDPKFAAQYQLHERWIAAQELSLLTNRDHPLHPIGYAGLSSASWSTILESDDAGWTRTPLEVRSPFLDQRVLRFLLRVPPVPWCMEKYLLREIMRGLLPEAIRLRPKTPATHDLFEASVDCGRWQPDLPLAASQQLSSFVDRNGWKTQLESGLSETSLWTDLRPLSLLYWLNNVENGA